MLIKKTQQTAGNVAAVSNLLRDSDTDTYSCNYINDKVDGTILFENVNGQTGDLTLNDDISNYDTYEIIASAEECMAVKQKAGKSVLIYTQSSDGTYIYTNMGRITIVGNQLTKDLIHNYYGTTNNIYEKHTTVDFYPIYRVIGHK